MKKLIDFQLAMSSLLITRTEFSGNSSIIY